MKIIKAKLPLGKTITSTETISFPNEIYNDNHIRHIENTEINLSSTLYESFVRVVVDFKVKVIVACAYTLEDVPLDLHIKDELIFTEDEHDEENFYEPGPTITLDDYILGLILARVPIKVVKKGAKLPEGGDSYRVIDEETLLEERKNRKDERWNVLDQLDLDEEK